MTVLVRSLMEVSLVESVVRVREMVGFGRGPGGEGSRQDLEGGRCADGVLVLAVVLQRQALAVGAFDGDGASARVHGRRVVHVVGAQGRFGDVGRRDTAADDADVEQPVVEQRVGKHQEASAPVGPAPDVGEDGRALVHDPAVDDDPARVGRVLRRGVGEGLRVPLAPPQRAVRRGDERVRDHTAAGAEEDAVAGLGEPCQVQPAQARAAARAGVGEHRLEGLAPGPLAPEHLVRGVPRATGHDHSERGPSGGPVEALDDLAHGAVAADGDDEVGRPLGPLKGAARKER
ncbi:hypothetical protein SALBM135S_01460 [Streptomyces alboniger]